MHLLGGLWAGFFATWAASFRKMRLSILLCALSALVMGIGWELFEYENGIGGSAFMGYWTDTVKDLVMDALGGAAAGIIIRRMRV